MKQKLVLVKKIKDLMEKIEKICSFKLEKNYMVKNENQRRIIQLGDDNKYIKDSRLGNYTEIIIEIADVILGICLIKKNEIFLNVRQLF